MRTLEEINLDSQKAVTRDDVDRMTELAEEYQLHDDPTAELKELRLRGIIAAFKSQLNEAIEFYERSIGLAKSMNEHRDASESLINLGHLHTRSGHTSEALKSYSEALTIAEEHGNEKGIATASCAVGMTLTARSEFDDALVYLMRALELDEQHGDLGGIAATNGNIAILHARMGEFSEALTFFERSKAAYLDAGDESGAANITSNIGTLYLDTANFAEALAALREALEVMEAKGWRYAAATIRASITIAYVGLRDFQKAEPMFHEVLQELREVGDRDAEGAMTANFGAVYEEQGNAQAAREQFQRAFEIHTELDDQESVALALANRGRAELRCNDLEAARATAEILRSFKIKTIQVRSSRDRFLAELAQAENNNALASSILTKALESIEDTEFRAERIEVLTMLRSLARSNGDLDSYITYNDQVTTLNEEIRGKEATVKVAMQEAERNIAKERQERERERAILYSTLPKAVADRIVRGEDVSGDHFDNAAVLFADIVGFTSHSSQMDPQQTTGFLATIFEYFDAICTEHNVTKVKTIGDSYMCFAHSDIGDEISDIGPEQRIAAVALAMQNAEFYWPTSDEQRATSNEQRATSNEQRATSNEQRATSNRIQLRIGIHCGPITAGVIGTQRLQYDIWGDTVNVASRMESTGEPGRIQVSEVFVGSCSLRSQDDARHPEKRSDEGPLFTFTPRGTIDIKGKGPMTTYWLEEA